MTFHMTGSNEMTDDATGVVIVCRGFAESWQKPFGFSDPRSSARSMTGSKFFYFVGDLIGGVVTDDNPKGEKLFEGYRFRRGIIGSALSGYHNGDEEKLNFAIDCIREAVTLYLKKHDRIAIPTVEFI